MIVSYKGWIAVDLDGTLAEYDGWEGPTAIGKPVPAMLDRVKRWVFVEGREVRIFTARVYTDGSVERTQEANEARDAIEGWCLAHVGTKLRVTCVKDYGMVQLWDDRAIQIEKNTGRRMDGLPEGEATP